MANAKSALEIGEDEFVIGNIDAPITIIEYASMSCSHCASFHNNTLPDIKKEYIDTGIVRIVFRDYPFNYPALLGSMMMRCISSDVRYDYMNALYQLQNTWVNKDPKTSKKERLIENQSLFDFELSNQEMSDISNLNVGRRFNDPGVFCESAFNTFFPIYD